MAEPFLHLHELQETLRAGVTLQNTNSSRRTTGLTIATVYRKDFFKDESPHYIPALDLHALPELRHHVGAE